MRQVTQLFLSTHPGPSLAVTTVTLVLALTAGLPADRVIIVTLAMLANQFSIGLSNDWLDAARDARASRTDKPVAAGLLSPTLVRNVACACVVISLGLSAWLSLGVLLVEDDRELRSTLGQSLAVEGYRVLAAASLAALAGAAVLVKKYQQKKQNEYPRPQAGEPKRFRTEEVAR